MVESKIPVQETPEISPASARLGPASDADAAAQAGDMASLVGRPA